MFIRTLKATIERIALHVSAVRFVDDAQGLEDEDPMKCLQSRIFATLSWCVVVFGLPLWCYSTFLFWTRGDQAVGMLTGLLYLFMALVLFSKAWDMRLRKLLFIAGLYTFSVAILMFTGLSGAGMVCVGFTLVLASCLLEGAWLGRVIIVNLAIFSILTMLLMLGFLESWPMSSYQPVWWIHAVTTQVLSAVLVITIRIITSSLGEHIHKWRDMVAHVEYLGRHDSLTGLLNRRAFDMELCRLDGVDHLPLTLMMLDVNGLKLTNDAFGHPAGDKMLTKAAGVLQEVCRADDIIARIGGDEFAILLPKLNAEQAHEMTKRIQQAVAAKKVEGLPISVSCGWATKTEEHESITDVFKTAEDYMYRHKISDRNSYRHQSIDLILQTLYAKSPREQAHSKRVSQLCSDLGTAMGLEVHELTTAGMLHDIGKVAISESILDKVPPLTDAEWTEMQRHPEAGYSILSAVNDYGPLAECALAHHERWDGRGYPNGLKDSSIPLMARIIAVVDAYDAMVSDRPYRKGMSHAEAVEEIEVCAGFQFDPEIVRVFIEMMRKREVGVAEDDES